ncbi:MAG: amidohydrolase [Anaerolineales bacterium]|nr:amidohydrolase [Anaerolineales bacterium]MCB8960713.1 amidohydrolase [Ardenticatenales bacterium]
MLDKAQALADELVRLRRDIHAHPELGFEEVRTAALVADTLSEIGGFEVKTGVGRTGVTAQIGSGEGPTIGIRADMDALPIVEATGTTYSSENPGVMHACGHDAHTAMLLGVAHLLRQSFAEEQWQGNVRLLFQPSEERFDDQGVSGATAMLADAAMADVDHVIALHVKSDRPAGEIRIHDEYSLAAVDSFEAWIFGDGGHGAYPHTGVDPLFILSSVLPALYGIPSRRINPLRESVVSLGRISGGEINNVIPNRVQLLGTIRSYDPDVRQQLWREVENALRISEMMGGRYEFKLSKGYPSLYNDPTVNTWLAGTARDLVDPAQVIYTEYGMGAEDFAYMAQKAPGAMFMLGAAIPDGKVRTHHTDTFDIDESVLPIGSAILAETARRYVTGRLG